MPGSQIEQTGLRDGSVAPQLLRMATVHLTPDGNALHVDACWTERTGLESSGSMGAGWLAAVHPDDLRLLESALREASRRASSLAAKLRLRDREGRFGWVQAHVQTHPYGDDRLSVSFCETRPDGSDPSHSEIALLRGMLQTMPVGVWILDRQGHVVQTNPAGEAIWQGVRYVGREELGIHYRAWWVETGEALESGDWPAAKAFQGLVTTDLLVEIEAFDGTRKVIRCGGAPITDDSGTIIGAVALSQDVTAGYRAEAALRKSEGLLRKVLDTLPVGVWLMDEAGTIFHSNPAGQRIWGGARFVGLDRFGEYEAWYADSGEQVLAHEWAGARAIRHGETSIDELLLIRCFDGSRRYILNSAVPIQDDAGRPFGAILVNQDVDELIRTRQERSLLADIVDSTGDAIVSKDFDNRITSWNPGAEQMFGYAASEALGQSVHLLTPPGLEAVVEARHAEVVAGAACHFESRRRRKDGSVVDVALSLAPIRDRGGRVVGVSSIARDITARRLAERQLALWGQAIESSRNGIMIVDAVDPAHPLIFVNSAFEALSGYARHEVLGRSAGFMHGSDRDQAGLVELRHAIAAGQPCRVLLRNYRKDGSAFWNELSVAPVRDEAGQLTTFVGILDDVSERIRYERQLEHQATHDLLTGLPNRNLLRDRCRQAMLAAERRGSNCAVLFLDLDGFKYINDSLGHDAGDALLQVAAQRLRGCIRAGDTVARLGGDEFVLLQGDLGKEQDASTLAQRLLETIGRPFDVGGTEVTVSASIGIAIFPRDGASPTELLKNADAAMYRAKEQGKNTYRYFSTELNQNARERLVLENRLRKALERQEFELFYQPQVDAERGQAIGVEALLRWRHPDIGLLSPDKFIPIAEETGLIVPIGEWVLREACRQMSAWRAESGLDLRVAVNLSARQFADAGLADAVRAALADSGLPAERLELELTESMLMKEPDRAVQILEQFKALGTMLSIDDFGTGYSSLSYLRLFPIDKLKIDRTFVAGLPDDARNAAIAGAVLDLGHRLGMAVIAEGVETAGQLACLQRMGCDEIQGYLCGRPVEAAVLGPRLQTRSSLFPAGSDAVAA